MGADHIPSSPQYLRYAMRVVAAPGTGSRCTSRLRGAGVHVPALSRYRRRASRSPLPSSRRSPPAGPLQYIPGTRGEHPPRHSRRPPRELPAIPPPYPSPGAPHVRRSAPRPMYLSLAFAAYAGGGAADAPLCSPPPAESPGDRYASPCSLEAPAGGCLLLPAGMFSEYSPRPPAGKLRCPHPGVLHVRSRRPRRASPSCTPARPPGDVPSSPSGTTFRIHGERGTR